MIESENRRSLLKKGAVAASAAIVGTGGFVGNMLSGTSPAAEDMKATSLPELPPKPLGDVVAKLFPGFVQTEVRTSGATIPVLHKGDGPPVLLLHGYPESRVTWHKVAPRLAEQFSVYVPDLPEIATSITRSGQWRWTRSRQCVILGTSSSLWVLTIGVLASPIGCASTFPRVSKRFVSWILLQR